jgi:hypothetical protein
MSSNNAKTLLKESLRSTIDLMNGEWHESATVNDLIELCEAASNDQAKILLILSWVASKPHDVNSWAARATLIRLACKNITFSSTAHERELLKTLLYCDSHHDEADVRQEISERTPDPVAHAQTLNDAHVFISLRTITSLMENAQRYLNAFPNSKSADHDEDMVSERDDSPPADDLSIIHQTLWQQFQNCRGVRLPGKNAFLFAMSESDWLATQLVSLRSPDNKDGIWAKVACHILQIQETASCKKQWESFASKQVRKPKDDGDIDEWTARLCALWGCLPFTNIAAEKFDSVWWRAANYAESLIHQPDMEMECTTLLYLITHLVYVQTAYMILPMDPHKREHLRGTFGWYIKKQIQERFIDVGCELKLNNVELLVELADFMRAVGFPVPMPLRHAFAQVTSAQVLFWLQGLRGNLDGAAHVVYLFQRGRR